MKEGIAAHVGELKGHADLGPKPKSVQPIRGEVYNVSGQTGENPVRKHVNELKWQTTLRGEPAPLQLTPQELEAAERLGIPLRMGRTAIDFDFVVLTKTPTNGCLKTRRMKLGVLNSRLLLPLLF
jgi:hypothetical protein